MAISGLIFFALSMKASISKSNKGNASILLIIKAWQISNIKGYFNGLSSPSGIERIIAFFVAPVSNSAGQTKLPTFSRMIRSLFAASNP